MYNKAKRYHCIFCTTQQETLTAAQHSKRHWLQHNTARDTDCCTTQQETLTAAQHSKRHWLLHNSARHRLLHNTTRDTDCCTIQQETLTAAQYSKRHWLLQITVRDSNYISWPLRAIPHSKHWPAMGNHTQFLPKEDNARVQSMYLWQLVDFYRTMFL